MPFSCSYILLNFEWNKSGQLNPAFPVLTLGVFLAEKDSIMCFLLFDFATCIGESHEYTMSMKLYLLIKIMYLQDDGGSTENVMARTFLIRLKTGEDRDQLATAIREYAPSS